MDKLANLPTPLKWFLGVTGAGTLVGTGVAGATFGWKTALIFALVLLVLLLVLVGGWLLWNLLKRRKQNARFGQGLEEDTRKAPSGMSATDLAKFDSMRKKFQEGIEAFRARGKDLYTLPWYVIIGEPGSGKTEAIRHCNVGFPPGLHEGDNDVGYMGAGGTINMNWWFTNYAVLLDTAGRLVFEEVKAGQTSEWKEFLKLLKKNRPYQPINGLMLVIPSDSLIKDSSDSIAAKGGKIAQQLDVIQRILDFRFPVYVVISKSDRINGFREFFEGLNDPQLQHQMLGWANPDPLDTPFRPDVVDQHLSQVADRLRRRRMGLLRDPIPETASRRTDEVDSLYALPHSLLMLAPRLRSYLEKIFMPGEWSAKPLFLRGIFFTSAMREGSALDQELAEALGLPADELPEGKVWERDRAYFLKDLFMEKAFREKGLVTRATNTKDMLRRRQMIVYASCFVLLAVFVTIGWLGMRTVQGEVGGRATYWEEAVRKTGWNGESFRRPILIGDPPGPYTPAGPFELNGKKVTLGEFHQKFVSLATNEIKARWPSGSLAASYNENSKKAQRFLFETSILQPLTEAVSQRMLNLSAEQTNAEPFQTEALAALIRLEADVARREKKTAVPCDTRAAAGLLGPLLNFAVNANAELDNNLVAAMTWTYTDNRAGVDAWPPAWLSRTVFPKEGRATNLVMMAGLDYFIRRATNTVQTMAGDWAGVSRLIGEVDKYEAAEKALFAAADRDKRSVPDQQLQKLLSARDELNDLLAACGKSNIFAGGLLLTNAYLNFTNSVAKYAGGAFARVNEANETALKVDLKSDRRLDVFQDIQKRLRAEQSRIEGSISSVVPAGTVSKLAGIDDCYLAPVGSPAYARRATVYQHAAELGAGRWFSATKRADLIAKLDEWDKARNAADQEAQEYKGCEREEVQKLSAGWREEATNRQPKAFLTGYQRAAEGDLTQSLGFPVLRGMTAKVISRDDLDSCQGLLERLREEASSIESRKLEDSKEWKSYTTRLAAITKVFGVLKGTKDKANYCMVTLLGYDGGNPADAWRNGTRGIRLRGQANAVDASQEEKELGKVDVLGPCTFQFTRRADSTEKPTEQGVDKPWGPIWLITQYGGKPSADGTWTVAYPLDEIAAGGKLRLKLRFDEPLPDLDHWPAN
jgi:hypothetical protein